MNDRQKFQNDRQKLQNDRQKNQKEENLKESLQTIDDMVDSDNAVSLTEMKIITDMYKEAQTLDEKKKIKEHIDGLVRKEAIFNLDRLKAEISELAK
jgi:hypothetical protein